MVLLCDELPALFVHGKESLARGVFLRHWAWEEEFFDLGFNANRMTVLNARIVFPLFGGVPGRLREERCTADERHRLGGTVWCDHQVSGHPTAGLREFGDRRCDWFDLLDEVLRL